MALPCPLSSSTKAYKLPSRAGQCDKPGTLGDSAGAPLSPARVHNPPRIQEHPCGMHREIYRYPRVSRNVTKTNVIFLKIAISTIKLNISYMWYFLSKFQIILSSHKYRDVNNFCKLIEYDLSDKDFEIRSPSTVGSFLHISIKLNLSHFHGCIYRSLLLWKNARFIYLKTYEYCPRITREQLGGFSFAPKSH